WLPNGLYRVSLALLTASRDPPSLAVYRPVSWHSSTVDGRTRDKITWGQPSRVSGDGGTGGEGHYLLFVAERSAEQYESWVHRASLNESGGVHQGRGRVADRPLRAEGRSGGDRHAGHRHHHLPQDRRVPHLRG